MKMWSRLSWLRTGSSSDILWTQWWTFGVHDTKLRKLLISCSTKILNYKISFWILYIVQLNGICFLCRNVLNRALSHSSSVLRDFHELQGYTDWQIIVNVSVKYCGSLTAQQHSCSFFHLKGIKLQCVFRNISICWHSSVRLTHLRVTW
jgi:hypothetical protein